MSHMFNKRNVVNLIDYYLKHPIMDENHKIECILDAIKNEDFSILEKGKITKKEKKFLECVESGYIAVDPDGVLCYFTEKPIWQGDHWDVEGNGEYSELGVFGLEFSQLFSHRYYSVAELLELEVIDEDEEESSHENISSRDIPMKVTEIRTDEYYCPNCGSENNKDCNSDRGDDVFCPNCGQKLGWPEIDWGDIDD